ncbi:MAG TPA: pyruvate kinase [Myxococcota bacterium]|nr:pyruvate kinase [Myxococcota bacterium]
MARKRVLRKTKVIATIGPASDSIETLKAMIRAGMNVARLNFSHGTHEEHRKRLECIRQAAREQAANVGVMLDTKGVEIRTGRLEAGAAMLNVGEAFTLYGEDRLGDAKGVSISYPVLAEEISVGAAVLLDDGVIELRVESIEGGNIHCRVARGGRLEDRKGVNVPGEVLSRTAAMSPQDREDLLFAIEHQVDYIAASFVRSGADVIEIQRFLQEKGANIPIIAKIENTEGVRNLEEIVAVANGTMVARGDLGVELPLPEVPLIQKKIIRTTVMNGKPVITATQMLDSMTHHPIPTRAEVSDVANAIFDGTSAVMLSGETAKGSYPVEAVRTMAALALAAEAKLGEYGHLQHVLPQVANVVTESVSQAAITLADHIKAGAVITLTESGFTARAMSKYRPTCPIFAVTVWPAVQRKLSMNWGITAVLFEGERSDEAMIRFAIRHGRDIGCLRAGDHVVVTAGISQTTGSTSMIQVLTVEDE